MTKILIAEDDTFLIKMYKINIGQAIPDAELEVAENGSIAIEKLDANQPDLLLLDLLMPSVDGFAVLEHIKEKGYDFPVVILTNLSQDIDKKKCTELGAEDYYVKSDMDLDELLVRIKKYIN